MKWFSKFPVWYSIVSCSVAAFVAGMLLLQSFFGNGFAGSGVVFFLFVAAYFNCLPLAIVSIFMFSRRDRWKYSLFNFAAIGVILYFVVKVFDKSI